MVIVRSRKKSEYLETLHQANLELGLVPRDGAYVEITDIWPFLKYFNDFIINVLFVSDEMKMYGI